jgi:hypothetical protein
MTKYRGRLYLHASRVEAKPNDIDLESWMWDDCPGSMATGAIIGSVELFDCVDAQEIEHCYDLLAKQTQRKTTDRHREVLPHLPPLREYDGKPTPWEWWAGQHAWLIRKPQRLAVPIPTGGKLQLWKCEVPQDLIKPAI